MYLQLTDPGTPKMMNNNTVQTNNGLPLQFPRLTVKQSQGLQILLLTGSGVFLVSILSPIVPLIRLLVTCLLTTHLSFLSQLLSHSYQRLPQ